MGVGQKLAIISYVRRPKRSGPSPLEFCATNSSFSGSCLWAQAMSPFASAMKPSNETISNTWWPAHSTSWASAGPS